MGTLQNQVAIITGGANGIGKAAVLRFVAEGARVAIWDMDETAGTALEQQFAEESVKFLRVNTTSAEECRTAATATIDHFGKIDILINNAGITRDATLAKMTSDQWQQVIDVNLTGVFNCTQAVQPFMVERQYGRIINTSSVVAHYGNFGQSNYVASKSAIIGLTKVWAKELGRKGINVNAVAPGFIATEMVNTIPEKVINMLKDKTPLGRLGLPEEIAAAYAFLASPDASFISGTCLQVDGAITL